MNTLQTQTNELDNKMLKLFIKNQASQSVQSAKVYNHTITAFIKEIGKPLATVTLDDVQDYSDSIAHLALATQHRMLSTIKTFYRFLATQPNYLIANPWEVFKLPKLVTTDEVERILTKEEVEAIRNVLRIRNFRNYVIISVLYATGLRISELLNARWSDFITDLDGNIGLRVLGKGKKKRTVKITPRVFYMIVEYRESEGLSATIGNGDDAPVFITKTGEVLKNRYIEKVFKQAVDEAGINKDATPHWLRHTHATLAIHNGADVMQVKDSLGHTNIQTSMRYLHTVNKLHSTTADFIDMV